MASSFHHGSSPFRLVGNAERRRISFAGRASLDRQKRYLTRRAVPFYLRSADRWPGIATRWPLTALSMEGVGSARFAGFHYRGALDAYLEARGFAERARDRRALGAIDADLASVYQQTWDLDSAVRSMSSDHHPSCRMFIIGLNCCFCSAVCARTPVRFRSFEGMGGARALLQRAESGGGGGQRLGLLVRGADRKRRPGGCRRG